VGGSLFAGVDGGVHGLALGVGAVVLALTVVEPAQHTTVERF